MYMERRLLWLPLSQEAIGEGVHSKVRHPESLASHRDVVLVFNGQVLPTYKNWELNPPPPGATASLEKVSRNSEKILGPRVAGVDVKRTENYKLSEKFSA